jgi:two-component system response regulator AlgR
MTKHILIADDSAFLREQLRLRIERHPGWEVCEAVDGVEAVRKSQKVAPDAVVLDLRMPEMDGLAAGRRLKATDAQIADGAVQHRHKFAT